MNSMIRNVLERSYEAIVDAVSTSMFEMSVNVYAMSESVSFCLELSRAAISLSPEKGRLVAMCGRAKDTLLCAKMDSNCFAAGHALRPTVALLEPLGFNHRNYHRNVRLEFS
uniref:Uncharacterized protein n=1 Tax=Timema monikensis TaxID=170555 RepID=A0A7R9EKI4_9NEOP|nr:unnamed protein product [Timema monikensis]